MLLSVADPDRWCCFCWFLASLAFRERKNSKSQNCITVVTNFRRTILCSFFYNLSLGFILKTRKISQRNFSIDLSQAREFLMGQTSSDQGTYTVHSEGSISRISIALQLAINVQRSLSQAFLLFSKFLVFFFSISGVMAKKYII